MYEKNNREKTHLKNAHLPQELCEKLEKGFMAIFVSELLMRLYAFGGAFLTNEVRSKETKDPTSLLAISNLYLPNLASFLGS